MKEREKQMREVVGEEDEKRRGRGGERRVKGDGGNERSWIEGGRGVDRGRWGEHY
jgi:hypothetical protein